MQRGALLRRPSQRRHRSRYIRAGAPAGAPPGPPTGAMQPCGAAQHSDATCPSGERAQRDTWALAASAPAHAKQLTESWGRDMHLELRFELLRADCVSALACPSSLPARGSCASALSTAHGLRALAPASPPYSLGWPWCDFTPEACRSQSGRRVCYLWATMARRGPRPLACSRRSASGPLAPPRLTPCTRGVFIWLPSCNSFSLSGVPSDTTVLQKSQKRIHPLDCDIRQPSKPQSANGNATCNAICNAETHGEVNPLHMSQSPTSHPLSSFSVIKCKYNQGRLSLPTRSCLQSRASFKAQEC